MGFYGDCLVRAGNNAVLNGYAHGPSPPAISSRVSTKRRSHSPGADVASFDGTILPPAIRSYGRPRFSIVSRNLLNNDSAEKPAAIRFCSAAAPLRPAAADNKIG